MVLLWEVRRKILDRNMEVWLLASLLDSFLHSFLPSSDFHAGCIFYVILYLFLVCMWLSDAVVNCSLCDDKNFGTFRPCGSILIYFHHLLHSIVHNYRLDRTVINHTKSYHPIVLIFSFLFIIAYTWLYQQNMDIKLIMVSHLEKVHRRECLSVTQQITLLPTANSKKCCI